MRTTLKTVALVVGFAVASTSGCICSNFMKFQKRAKQSEAKTNLKGVFTSFKAKFAESGECPTTFAASGWRPEAGHLYSYYVFKDAIPSQVEAPIALPSNVGTFVKPKVGEFQIAAVANLDGDDTLDIWTINHENELKNVSNDVQD